MAWAPIKAMRGGRMVAPLVPAMMAASIGPISNPAGSRANSSAVTKMMERMSRNIHCSGRRWRANNSGWATGCMDEDPLSLRRQLPHPYCQAGTTA